MKWLNQRLTLKAEPYTPGNMMRDEPEHQYPLGSPIPIDPDVHRHLRQLIVVSDWVSPTHAEQQPRVYLMCERPECAEGFDDHTQHFRVKWTADISLMTIEQIIHVRDRHLRGIQ